MTLQPGISYLFDTTFLSDLIDGRPSIRPAQLAALSEGASGYSQITLAEILVKPVNAREYVFREHLLSIFHCYQITDAIARQAGEFRRFFVEQRLAGTLGSRRNLPDISDCFIAATALANQLTLYTRDERHGPLFRAAGVPVTTYALDS